MSPLVSLEVALTFSIAVVMSLIAYVWLSRLFSSMMVTQKQLMKTLPTALVLPAIPIVLFIMFNPQKLNLAQPLTYLWELIFFAVLIFLFDCRAYFFYFGKKNMVDTSKSRPSP